MQVKGTLEAIEAVKVEIQEIVDEVSGGVGCFWWERNVSVNCVKGKFLVGMGSL